MPHRDNSATRTCLVVSDGRRGIENQALGLAEALSHLCEIEISRHVITSTRIFKALPSNVQYQLKHLPKDYGIKAIPNIVIGCGRQAIAPLRALKQAAGGEVFTVYIQDPRTPSSHFDLVIAPSHDGLTGDNVQTMIGSPNRITDKVLAAAVQKFSKKIGALTRPCVAMLIGGNSKSHTLSRNDHREHIRAVHTLLDQGMSIMLSTSRRTPQWVAQDYRELAKKHAHMWLWDGAPTPETLASREGQKSNDDDNPYFAFLGAADAILVTQDSTNMLTEACATGKPVFTLEMQGKSKKFVALYKELEQDCHVVPFTGSIQAPDYSPSRETQRMANILLQCLDKI